MNPTYTALTQYLGAFSVLNELPADSVVPPAWQALLGSPAPDRIRLVIALWEQQYPREFSTLLSVFRQHLVAVEVLAQDTKCSLLYVFKNPRGEYLHYLGQAPLVAPQLPATLSGFPWPDRFLPFYAQLHNGWYEVVSHAVGLLPLEEMLLLSEHEWGILEELDLPSTFSLTNVLGVLSSGAGGYLCWNFNEAVPAGLVWWDDEAPDVVEFWDILDEWAAMGIQDY
ncbi:MAG: hypothetical protein EOO62_12795 [Hymenobacter sp.]|nr:MAG: hypothetical protein EOO62_12795 [Hymenobacter sp.]